MTSNGAGRRRGPKKRKCDAYVVFEKNLKRSRAFIRIFGEENRPQGRPSSDERELLRGALVFSIGALDNFIHELILEIIPKFGGSRRSMKAPLSAIAKADPGLSLRIALASPGAAEAEFRDALDSWLETQSFHGVSKILGALGFIGITLDESVLLPDWKQRLEEFTGERHQIVHRGSTKVIKRDDAKACADLVEAIAKSVNSDAVKHYHATA
jgi:hypothetical protein